MFHTLWLVAFLGSLTVLGVLIGLRRVSGRVGFGAACAVWIANAAVDFHGGFTGDHASGGYVSIGFAAYNLYLALKDDDDWWNKKKRRIKSWMKSHLPRPQTRGLLNPA